MKMDIYRIEQMLNGSASRDEIGERNPSGVQGFLYNAFNGMENSYGPTAVHKKSLATSKSLFAKANMAVDQLSKVSIPAIEKALKQAGAPYINGE